MRQKVTHYWIYHTYLVMPIKLKSFRHHKSVTLATTNHTCHNKGHMKIAQFIII